MKGCSDGAYPSTEEKFFECPSEHGLYIRVPLANVRPDERFTGVVLSPPISHPNRMKNLNVAVLFVYYTAKATLL